MVARLDGKIVRDIVKADGKGFMRGLALWFLLAIPSSVTNSMVSVYIPSDIYSINLRSPDPSFTIPARPPAPYPPNPLSPRPLSVF